MRSSANFVCFGEILWDVFLDKQHLGGAPLNVALRLASLCSKKSVQIVSAVGQDTLGKAALLEVNNANLLSDNIQTNKYPTGSVNVTLSEAGNASYSIKTEVAWDYIAETKDVLATVNVESVFVYGSLAARSAVSRATLMSLINVATFTVFDVNLRAPFYDLDVVFEFMKKTSFIKMNAEELKLICRHRYGPSARLEEQLQWLQITTSASFICVTGGKRSLFASRQNVYRSLGNPNDSSRYCWCRRQFSRYTFMGIV